MRWYISATAVKQYMEIVGYPPQEDGPHFDRAERELSDICDTASPKGHYDSGAERWQGKTVIDGRSERLELTVSTAERKEGDLPQLVNVRHRGRGRR